MRGLCFARRDSRLTFLASFLWRFSSGVLNKPKVMAKRPSMMRSKMERNAGCAGAAIADPITDTSQEISEMMGVTTMRIRPASSSINQSIMDEPLF